MKFFTSLFLVLSTVVFAEAKSSLNHTSRQQAYYGEHFYNSLASGVSNDELKEEIKTVLRSYHKKTDGLDEILDRCNGQGCYSQGSLGYNGARTFLMGTFYLVKQAGDYGVRDVYCDTVRTNIGAGPGRIPNNNSVNTEHTWPQSRFNSRLDKGYQKADMHHLYPTDSKANSIRGNSPFGEVAQDTQDVPCNKGRYGRPVGGHGSQVFEPPSNHKGNVARALFYFSLRYDLPISEEEEGFLRKWSQEDPIDQDEADRNDEIYKLQGNRNPFIDIPALEDRIRNF